MSESSTFYVSAPLQATKRTLQSVLEHNGLPTSEPYEDVLTVRYSPDKFEQLSEALAAKLSREELQEARCRMGRVGAALTQAELMHTDSLESFFAWVRGRWLAAMVCDRRLTTFFQPIVECRNPQKVFAYECLLRGQQTNGQLVSPDRLYSTARDVGQLNSLDHAAKITHIESSARFGLGTNIFINFNPAATRDLKNCLEKTLDAVTASGIPSERFVFEVIESDKIENPNDVQHVLASYRQMGFRVALDDVGSGYNSLNSLTQIRPDFIKLDMHLIRGVHQDAYKARVAAKLLELARDLGVSTVVEGVEEPAEWQWAADHGADYAQGYLFARPDATPPQPQFHPAS
jgi:EAL domain-containing protein (putative c-di-GMP-specific phosphodiesterase class I)